jgi:hypothetical protein
MKRAEEVCFYLSSMKSSIDKIDVCDSASKSMHNELQITFNDSFENRLKIKRFLEIKSCLLEIFLQIFDFVETL